MQTNEPLLHFNFADSEGIKQPMIFTNPKEVLIAWTIEDIMPCMEAIQIAVDEGYYAAGYISYEGAPAFDPNVEVKTGNNMPLLWFGIFNEPIKDTINSTEAFKMEAWQPSVTIDNYNESIDNIHTYIKQLKTKQVNYTIQLESEFSGDPIAFYKQLEHAQSANYAAYLNIGDYSILSASPELFFQVKNGVITTKPMKGTVGRGKTYAEDIKKAKWLQASKKNRNENKLIVDLMADELAAIAQEGTVAIPHLYEIEKYPTLYQMTSTVTADLAPEVTIIDIFNALFPCGSITGLPKKETMDIITQLETKPREVYCGTIGFITPAKEAVFSIPIRTVLIDNETNRAQYGVGGGITIDSTKEEEYAEVLTKAKLLTKEHAEFKLLESLRLDHGQYFLLEEHLKRLKQSAHYFDFKINDKQINKQLISLAHKHPVEQWKVRLLLSKDGDISIEADEIQPLTKTVTVALAKQSVTKREIFLYHKTTNRSMYDTHKNAHPDHFDVLLFNEAEEITEFTIGNVVIQLEGKLITPPIESGLLAGTFRESLLEDGTITEQCILVSDIHKAEKTWLINSVRKWVPVQFED